MKLPYGNISIQSGEMTNKHSRTPQINSEGDLEGFGDYRDTELNQDFDSYNIQADELSPIKKSSDDHQCVNQEQQQVSIIPFQQPTQTSVNPQIDQIKEETDEEEGNVRGDDEDDKNFQQQETHKSSITPIIHTTTPTYLVTKNKSFASERSPKVQMSTISDRSPISLSKMDQSLQTDPHQLSDNIQNIDEIKENEQRIPTENSDQQQQLNIQGKYVSSLPVVEDYRENDDENNHDDHFISRRSVMPNEQAVKSSRYTSLPRLDNIQSLLGNASDEQRAVLALNIKAVQTQPIKPATNTITKENIHMHHEDTTHQRASQRFESNPYIKDSRNSFSNYLIESLKAQRTEKERQFGSDLRKYGIMRIQSVSSKPPQTASIFNKRQNVQQAQSVQQLDTAAVLRSTVVNFNEMKSRQSKRVKQQTLHKQASLEQLNEAILNQKTRSQQSITLADSTKDLELIAKPLASSPDSKTYSKDQRFTGFPANSHRKTFSYDKRLFGNSLIGKVSWDCQGVMSQLPY